MAILGLVGVIMIFAAFLMSFAKEIYEIPPDSEILVGFIGVVLAFLGVFWENIRFVKAADKTAEKGRKKWIHWKLIR